MTPLHLIGLIIVAGFLLWLVNTVIPMEANLKRLLNIVVIVLVAAVALFFLLSLFGISLGSLNHPIR